MGPHAGVLEIGGTHVTAALVDLTTWAVRPGTLRRDPLGGDWGAAAILAALIAAADAVGAPAGAVWGVATPGPFDYHRGVAQFRGVGKFESLYGCDVRAALGNGMAATPSRVEFIGDAEAFLLGEALTGAAVGAGRSAALTVGTGIGSAFLAGGRLVDDGPLVPPGGQIHRVRVGGRPLEELVSRRAIVASYRSAAGPTSSKLDVHEIAAAARSGHDRAAQEVLDTAFRVLGTAVAPWLRAFEAERLVVGGSVAGSWDLLAGPLAEGLGEGGAGEVTLRRGLHLETSPLVGAARVSAGWA